MGIRVHRVRRHLAGRQPGPSRWLIGIVALLLVGATCVGSLGSRGPGPDNSAQTQAQTQTQGTVEGDTADGECAAEGEGDGETEAEAEECENEGEMIRARDNWFYSWRTDGTRHPAPDRYLKARRQADRLKTAALAAGTTPLPFTELGPHAIGGSIGWQYGGPKPYAGRVTSIAPDPLIKGTVYIGTANGGVWKTENDGATWRPLTDGLASLAIGSVAVDPSNHNVVYVGTGEPNLGSGAYLGAGVFKSLDGGGHWTKLFGSTFDNCHITGLEVAPTNANLVLLTATGVGGSRFDQSNYCSGREGVWRSDDGGSTFTRPLQNGIFSDIGVAPNNSAVWYAAEARGGIWKTTNAGLNWTKLAGGLPTTGFYRIDLDVVASTTSPTQVVYAAVATTNGYLQGLYRSDDGGASWFRQNQSTDVCTSANGQCNYDLTVAVSPTNPNRAYLGGVYVDRYTSGVPTRVASDFSDGVTGNDGIHTDIHATAFDNFGRLWVGTDGGIYRTADGSTFANLNADLGTALVYPGISGRYAGPLYAGGQDNGSFRYTGSRTWTQVNLGDGFFTAADPNNPVPAYTELYNARITKHTPTGTCNAGHTDSGSTSTAPFNSPLVVNPGNRNYLYSGTYRVWRSTNAGTTACDTSWSLASQGFGAWVTTIGPAPSNTNVVYASTDPNGTTHQGLWVTTGSTTWSNTSANGLPVRYYTDIAVSPVAPGTAWVTASGFSTGHLFRTTNYGANWVDVSGNLPNAPASAVAVDNRTSPSTLYVGTDVGVLWSNDGGASWANTSVNLPNAVVSDILVDKAADQLIVATYGRGVWAAPLPKDSVTGDLFASALPVTSLPFSQAGLSNSGAGPDETGEPTSCGPMGKTLWWRYHPATDTRVTVDTVGSAFDTVLAVQRGTSLATLTQVACDDDGGGGGTGSVSAVTVNLTGGQTYYFQVGGFKDTTANTVASGNVTLHVTGAAANSDAFAGATSVGAVPYSRTGLSNTNAAPDETGEPTSCGPMGKTLWWKYLPAADTRVTANTVGSDFDTVLAVYRGTSLAGLTQVGCDDDGGGGGTGSVSAATVNLTGGQTYYFQVGGFKDTTSNATATGNVTFRISAAAATNDAFASAVTIGALPFASPALANAQASTETGEPVPGCAPIGKTLWWRWTPSVDTTVSASTTGSGFDTVLAIYRGTSLAGLVPVGCDDDAAGSGSTSAVDLTLSGGQTYYFQAGGYATSSTNVASGGLKLSLTPSP